MSCTRIISLLAIICIVGASALHAQYFYFEEKPFMPIIDSGKYKLEVGGGLNVSTDLNFRSSFTFTRHLYVFYGYNAQNGNREWTPILGDRQKTELDNHGSFWGIGIVWIFQ